MATKKKEPRGTNFDPMLLDLAMPAEEMRRYYERALELQEREVEALEKLIYLLDHWPHGTLPKR